MAQALDLGRKRIVLSSAKFPGPTPHLRPRTILRTTGVRDVGDERQADRPPPPRECVLTNSSYLRVLKIEDLGYSVCGVEVK